MKFSSPCVLAVVSCAATALMGTSVQAFVVTNAPQSAMTTTSSASTSTTALHAATPFIIGPMIKKMREENAKKNKPMIEDGEAVGQAPGLRVGKGAWKWPPVWPYDASFFTPVGQAKTAMTPKLENVASMLSGVPNFPAATDSEDAEADTFNAIRFWEEQGNIESDLDEEAAQKLSDHFAFYLRDGMSVLEFGAGDKSYLPSDLKLSRHVGVSANSNMMDKNPALTEKLVVDLNKVVEDQDVDSDDLRRLAKEPFDAIIMTNTVAYLTSPREVFRSAWYLLKPGGIMMVAFCSKEAEKSAFADAQTQMWKQYNDDQHIWMTGSFFQFSAGDGWEQLLGFDISPESAKKLNAAGVDAILDRGKPNNMFVVQAVKGYQDDSVNPDNLERSIRSLCWMLPVMEARDKKLVVPRLVRAYQTAEQESVKQAINDNIQHLPTIYESLIKMDQYAFTFSMQAQMATDLVCDPDFNGNDEQIQAMKRGLGLKSPDEEFWIPVGKNTANMEVEDKISLLAYIVPRFGSGNPAQEEALKAFVTGMQPTYAVIREKCPDLGESDVQLIGTEFLAAEVLRPGASTRQEYAVWLSALTAEEIKEFLETRKSIRSEAKEELEAFRQARAAAMQRQEEFKQKRDEQIKAARKERSMVFNPRTQKMEVYDNPNNKKKGFLGIF